MLLLLVLLGVFEVVLWKALVVLLIITAVSSILFYGIVNRIRPEEQEKIRSAEPLQWRMLTMEEQDAFLQSKQAFLPATLLILGFECVAGIVALLRGDFRIVLPVMLTVMLLTVGFHGVLKAEEHFWSAMDESAECARIPIDSNFNGYELRRQGVFQVKYAVFYTPEGKFVVKLSDVMRFGNRLYLVRFRGRYDYADFSR